MKRRKFNFVFLILLLVWACDKHGGDDSSKDILDVSGIKFPATVEGRIGEKVSVTAPTGKVLTTDYLVFKAVSGTLSFESPVAKIEAGSFLFTIPEGMISGRYIVHIRRGDNSKTIGTSTFTILSDLVIDPDGKSLFGWVSCAGKGVKDVVVSDGVEVVVTDSDGIYRINSGKTTGFVFISIPSGYEVVCDGVLPKIHQVLTKAADEPERVDFQLVKVSNDKHKVLVMGDIHLANRNGDRDEFKRFTADITDYCNAHPGEKIYGLTLGDMTWDAYWYTQNYFFPQYLNDVNAIKGVPIFHTIGNHDHDMKAAGDVLTIIEYIKDIAPNYYSFNIGKIHYVVLDNIVCTNDGSGTSASRKYVEQVTAAQYAWLKKDLSYVADKTAPVVVAMHAPIYRDNSSANGLTPSAGLTGWSTLVNCFSGFQSVHFLSGHTHRSLNVKKSNYFEHNAAAVCASWWWSQKLSKGFDVCTDGTPGGYTIWNVNGTDIDWVYKGTKEEEDYQFRTYDLNNVCFDASSASVWVPSASEWARNRFLELYAKWYPKSSNNEVLLNVWNYDPSWKVTAVEKTASGDKTLNVTQVQTYDPLHIMCVSAKRYNDNISSDPSFTSNLTTHMFKVKASAADTTIEFTVTDRFGREYKEIMKRPRPFNLSNYATGYSK